MTSALKNDTMNKIWSGNIKALLITATLLLITQLFSFIPWWGFVIPVLGFGLLISNRSWQVSAFTVGFAAGFIVWLGASLYFDLSYGGLALNKVGLLLGVPKFVVMLISGIIGGLITALALYTGKTILTRDTGHPAL